MHLEKKKKNLFPKHFECLLQFLFPSYFKSKLWDIPLTSSSGEARHLGNSKSNFGF